MKQLPAQLAPWSPWLSLFPITLAEPLGALLLRLHLEIGPLRSMPSRVDHLPEGVGSIVQRGPYERMLISEWAYADAEPDEFIRRAASGELLFTGPEPAARQRSRRCVALFDAGPAQLGEPRLLHLALFILLSRRAEEAGAEFHWGVLQRPGVLDSHNGTAGMQKLLKSRTAAPAPAEAGDAWLATLDKDNDDIWLICAPGMKPPCQVRGQVAIRRAMLGEQLDVVLTQHQSVRRLQLPLPASDIGVRLLRSPFEQTVKGSSTRNAFGLPSLDMAPRFATTGDGLLVRQVDGKLAAYPSGSRRHKGGKQKLRQAPDGKLLGAAMFNGSVATLVSKDGALLFQGFPSELLGNRTAGRPLPDPMSFRPPEQETDWLPLFFIRERKDNKEKLFILTLDLDRRLLCWMPETTYAADPIPFRTISDFVIGAEQFGSRVVLAFSRDGRTEIHTWTHSRGCTKLLALSHPARRILFGDIPSWYNSTSVGLYAWQDDSGDWYVRHASKTSRIGVHADSVVLGVASRGHLKGLVVLDGRRRTITLRGENSAVDLVVSAEDIAQASYSPMKDDLAWIGAESNRICVQGLTDSVPRRRMLMDEVSYDT